MLSATYTQGQGFAVTELPIPEIGDNEALLRVKAAALCGTDIKIVRGGHRKLSAGQRIVLGHEFCGVVEQVGSCVRGLKAGMRLGFAPNWGCGYCAACIRGMANLCPDFSAFGIDIDGAHAPFVRIPAEAIAQGNWVEIAESVPWDEAALAEPLACVLNGQKAVRLAPGESILIYGAGPMGLLHLLLARAIGAARVIIADPVATRLQKALELGADAVINNGSEHVAQRIKALCPSGAVDVAIIAAPVREAAEEALGLLAPFGRLCLFAGLRGAEGATFNCNAIHYNHLTVTGVTGGPAVDYRAALNLIAARRVDVRPVISHRFALPNLAAAYEQAMAGQGLKIVLTES